MKVAIEVFVSILILALTMSLCIGLISSDLAVMEARDHYYSYVNELQESNFADSVVSSCINSAQEDGYSLMVNILEDDNGNRSANISMTYTYKVFSLGIAQDKMIKGYVS